MSTTATTHYELREHSSGLNADSWDHLFNIIRTFGRRTDFQLPDRAQVTMTAPFMRAYTELLVRTCHKRGAHAIGGMAAHVPSKDPAANEAALAKVRLDKEREAEDGFDGSWITHPGLVPLCRDDVLTVLDEECAALAAEQPDALVPQARAVLERTALERDLPAFFTPDAYSRHLVRRQEVQS